MKVAFLWSTASKGIRLEKTQNGDIVPILGLIRELLMPPITIGDALFSKTQQRVLGLLFGQPDKSFYTNEIMRWAAIGAGRSGASWIAWWPPAY